MVTRHFNTEARRRGGAQRKGRRSMPGLLLFLCFPLRLCASALSLDQGSEAADAIRENIPQAAIPRLQETLERGNLSPAGRAATARLLTRALLDAGRAGEALDFLASPADPDESSMKAEALAALGRWAEALPIYAELARDRSVPFFQTAVLGQAEALHALRRTADAAGVLQSLEKPGTKAGLRLADFFIELGQVKRAQALLAGIHAETTLEKQWQRLDEARLLLAQDQAAPALEIFESIARQPRGVTDGLFAGAAIGIAEARAILNGFELADDALEDFIWHHSASASLEEIFARLDAIYAQEENPTAAELQRWAQLPPARRAALAQFYYAREMQREKKTEKASRAYQDFLRDFPVHALAGEAWRRLGALCLENGKPAQAVSALEAAMRASRDAETRARTELAMGVAHFQAREFLLAANTFRDAARRAEGIAPGIWQQATHNAALSWLNLGNYDKFLEDYNALCQRAPESEFRPGLLIEEGLLLARSRDGRAGAELARFVHDFPRHPRAPEARLALAEIAFAAGELDTANQWLRVADEAAPDAAAREPADFLAIFVADAAKDRDDARTLALCQKYLRDYPDAAHAGEARMKLGQVYFRREDFANAQTQFETLAEETSPLTEAALFLAGQAAMRSMNTGGVDRALELFERAAKLGGPLRLYARQEQAIAKTQMGKENEAVILYDDILRAGPESALRLAALCGKADCLAAAASDPQGCAKAMGLYDQLAADPEATRLWRDQALYKKAKCLEKQNRAAEALAVFYEALAPQPAGDPEFLWFYKSGFDAARMLEAQEQWRAAIGVYEKMARAQGPRAAEAKARAEQLRLERFIWDG